MTENAPICRKDWKRQLQGMIIQLLSQHAQLMASGERIYPLSTQEIAASLPVKIDRTKQLLAELHRSKMLYSRTFKWPGKKRVGTITLHLLHSQRWPLFLFKVCGDCQNLSRTNACLFHKELYEFSQSDWHCNYDETRVNTRINRETAACPWLIPRAKGPPKKMLLEEFTKKYCDKHFFARVHELEEKEETLLSPPEAPLPCYKCPCCHEQLAIFGWGFQPAIGSSIKRCPNCGALFKLIFEEKSGSYFVLFCAENFHLYKRNFEQLANGLWPEPGYESGSYGISIPDGVSLEDFEKKRGVELNFTIETLFVFNWRARLKDLSFISVPSLELKDFFADELAKDYSQITIILREPQLVSPPPTPQQKGILQLLRQSQVLNLPFAMKMLENRDNVLASVEGLEAIPESLRKQSVQQIESLYAQLQAMSKRGEKLSPARWNELDMNAAKEMWKPIRAVFREHHFDHPERKNRFTTERFRPYGLAPSFSPANTLVNACFTKMQTRIKVVCNAIHLCWDGLPGICHTGSRRGVYDFLLDVSEPFKLAPIPPLLSAIDSGEITVEEVPSIISRRRERLFFLWRNSVLNEQIDDLLERLDKLPIPFQQQPQPFSSVLSRYFTSLKGFLDKLILLNYDYQIQHHGKSYAPWAAILSDVWKVLPERKRKAALTFVDNCVARLDFTPFSFKPTI